MNKALLLLLLVGCFGATSAQNARTVVDKMYRAIESNPRVSFDMLSKERFGSRYVVKKTRFHVSESPRKVYMKDLEEGIEVLYVKGWNDNDALVNPNGFPWTNLDFSPRSSRMRKNQHHTILSAGFGYTAELMKSIEQDLKKQGRRFEDYFSISSTPTTFDGRSCYKLYINYDEEYGHKTHTVQRTATLATICKEQNVPEHRVAELNNLDYGEVRAGTSLKIPNAYAKRVVFYVDKTTHFPIVQLIYDEDGLYEKYEYRSLDISPNFPSCEWTPDCSSYGF